MIGSLAKTVQSYLKQRDVLVNVAAISSISSFGHLEPGHYDVVLACVLDGEQVLRVWPGMVVCEPVMNEQGRLHLIPLRLEQAGAVRLVERFINQAPHRSTEHAMSSQQTVDDLAQVARYKDELIQCVSHELRTPLTYIMGYVDLVLEGEAGALNPDQAASLQIVSDKTRALVRLVTDLMSSGQPGESDLLLDVVNLGVVVKRAVQMMRINANECGVTLNAVTEPGVGLVLADQDRIGQVLDNLLGNALKFSAPGATVTVRVLRREQYVRIEVEDTGIGIPPQHQIRIFERFYQVDAAARRQGGLGLGLAICKQIVEAHDGYIGVISQPGVGSRFFFELPEVEAYVSASSAS